VIIPNIRAPSQPLSGKRISRLKPDLRQDFLPCHFEKAPAGRDNHTAPRSDTKTADRL